MKKIATFAIVSIIAAVIGTALTGVASEQLTSTDSVSHKSTKPCCQTRVATGTQNIVESTKARCCNLDNASKAKLVKTDVCSGESCKLAKPASACEFCEKNDTSKSADSVTAAPLTVAKTGACNDKECLGAASNSQNCTPTTGGKCNGACDEKCEHVSSSSGTTTTAARTA